MSADVGAQLRPSAPVTEMRASSGRPASSTTLIVNAPTGSMNLNVRGSTRCFAAPGMSSTQSAVFPPSLEMYAMCRASRDQRGLVASKGPYVSSKGTPPSLVMSQSWLYCVPT